MKKPIKVIPPNNAPTITDHGAGGATAAPLAGAPSAASAPLCGA